jgi:phosphoribosylglycinamide formyltransferase-1
MNYAFYVSGKATRLAKILEDKNMELLTNIKVVFSDDEKNQYLEEKLKVYNIPYVLFDYNKIIAEKGQKNLRLSNELLEVLRKYQIDYCFSFGDHILKGELLEVYKNRIINFHPSILPAYPGLKSIDQAISDKANLLGNTVHFIDSGVDTGPIILQSVIPAAVFEEGGYDAILDIQIDMLYKVFNLLQAARLQVVKNKVNIEGANYRSYSIFPCI